MKLFSFLFLFGYLVTASAVVPIATSTSMINETTWNQIAIGGGGYVLQTFFHPDGHVYMKTDVGGAYRRVNDSSAHGGYSWKPLLDFAGPDQSEYYSVSAIAMSPESGATVFILSGAYWAYSNCTVLISNNAGDTWSVAIGSKGWSMKCGGNENDRAVGDRMSLHPTIPNLVAIGGSDGAVYISTDGFMSIPIRVQLPTPASTTPCNPEKNNTCVVRNIVWLSTASGTTILIAAVPSLGLFASSGPDFSDSSTWSFIKGSGGDATMPSDINRIALPGIPGQLWVTCGKGGVWKGIITNAFDEGIAISTSCGNDASSTEASTELSSADKSSNVLSSTDKSSTVLLSSLFSPSSSSSSSSLSSSSSSSWQVTWEVSGALSEQDVPFSGIAVRNGGNDIVVMSMLYDNNTTLYRSIDSGSTFTKLNWTCTSSVPWWGKNDFNTNLNAASSLSLDSITGQIWATDFFGTYVSDFPESATSLSFQNVETGHEEVCMNTIREPTVGHLLSGAADVGGWLHDQGIDSWPSSTFKAADGWAHNCLFSIDFTLSLASSGTSVDTVWVTAGDEYGSCHGNPSWCGLHSWVGVSRDGGVTFQDTTWDDIYSIDQANPYRVAVHPFDGQKAVVASRSGLPLTYTRDFGKTWNNSSGNVASVGQQGNFWYALPLATDKQIDETATEAIIYYYNGTTTLFTSIDSGASFSSTFSSFPTWNVPYFAIATPPRGTSAIGDIWVFAGWQLHHSINGGVNFSGVWAFYHPSTTITIGPLPAITSSQGYNSSSLANLCAIKGRKREVESGYTQLPPQPLTSNGAPAGYVVYAIGIRNYDEPTALFASIDFGHSWIPLSGANATAEQGLGDSPLVLEASIKDPGIIYVGTGGRGAFVRNVTNDLVKALLECE
jgi:hypothetical protein